MGEREFLVSFVEASAADANRYSEDLRAQLLAADPSVRVDRKPSDSTAMDFGTTLVLVLSAPATIELAKALVAWAKRNNRANVRVVSNNGTLVAENLESKNVAAVVRALTES